MKTVLFIHGAGKPSEDKPMVDGLQRNLGRETHVLAPEMPDADQPSYAKWRDEIVRLLKTLDNPVLVGHSLGASVLLKLLSEESRPGQVCSLHLLAAPCWGAPDWDVKDYALADDFAAHLPADLPIFLYHNEDDEVVPVSHLSAYTVKLPEAKSRQFKRGGHQFRYHLNTVVADIQSEVNHAEIDR